MIFVQIIFATSTLAFFYIFGYTHGMARGKSLK